MPQEGQAIRDGQHNDPANDHPAQVDVNALAEKVYRLLREDIRLARAYGVQRPRR